MVLFPIAFASQLEMAHVEAILIHEMAHIRRNDFLLNIIKTVMETILFFNPFTWLCSSLIEREREHACDDLVVQKTHTPLTYAHALLQIELITEKQTPVLTLAASGNHHNLYQRIKRITDMKTTYNTAKQQLLAITLTVLTLVTLAWINPVTSKTTIKKKIVSLTTTQVSINTVTAVANAQDTLKNKKSKNLNKTKSTKIKGKPAPPPPAPPAEPAVAEMPEPPAAPASINLPALPAPPAAPSRAPIEKVQQQAEVIKKYFQSVDWKKQQAALERSARQIEKKVNSNAWRRQVEIAKQEGLVMAKLVHSPAFKKQMADLRLQSQVLALQGQKLAEQFQAQAWKNQEKDIEIQQQLDVNCEETPAHSAKTPDEQCADK
jgi:bla regulator protein BlaR1